MLELNVKCQVRPDFWKDKRVFITGHTGFKGGWLLSWLHLMGAKTAGYALTPSTYPAIFNLLDLGKCTEVSHIADIRDIKKLSEAMISFAPDIVIHMAAQPLVRYSYHNPIETYQVNVMGTAHVLEVLRNISSVKATVIVTTDKCYENKGQSVGYSEDEPMGGYDPYSSSKGCAELLTSAYRRSFFNSINNQNAIASARAGNVIGGGDWSRDRLIPDLISALEKKQCITVRYPKAIRPWQHVLEPLSGYLVLAQALYEKGQFFASGWNFGPDDKDVWSVQEVIDRFDSLCGGGIYIKNEVTSLLHEEQILKLDCAKSKRYLGWYPQWSTEVALKKVVDWHKSFADGLNMNRVMEEQIESYQ
jgi:CDP-glucose 4,6-dehydratase